jgi:hypothetical protein
MPVKEFLQAKAYYDRLYQSSQFQRKSVFCIALPGKILPIDLTEFQENSSVKSSFFAQPKVYLLELNSKN